MTLLLRAFHHWDFPKGIREAGEEPMQAAIREVAEETGITELSFDWGDRFFETGPYSRGKVARYFIAVTSESFDEAYDLGSPRVRQIVQWARQIIGA
jgi:8-oxo-dGTP pyrophosphatase MutT (NUDIX family)